MLRFSHHSSLFRRFGSNSVTSEGNLIAISGRIGGENQTNRKRKLYSDIEMAFIFESNSVRKKSITFYELIGKKFSSFRKILQILRTCLKGLLILTYSEEQKDHQIPCEEHFQRQHNSFTTDKKAALQP